MALEKLVSFDSIASNSEPEAKILVPNPHPEPRVSIL